MKAKTNATIDIPWAAWTLGALSPITTKTTVKTTP